MVKSSGNDEPEVNRMFRIDVKLVEVSPFDGSGRRHSTPQERQVFFISSHNKEAVESIQFALRILTSEVQRMDPKVDQFIVEDGAGNRITTRNGLGVAVDSMDFDDEEEER
jgi:hypothetical protein